MRYGISPAVLIFLAFFIIPFSSCRGKKQHRDIERAFYYWKSSLQLTTFEEARLDSLRVNTLYIKFFDVDWDEKSRIPKPVVKLQSTGYRLKGSMLVVPTVFITNECIQRISAAQTAELANNLDLLIRDIIQSNGFNSIAEIQIDCDWTAATKDAYFTLLEHITALWKNTEIPISATIRLHQVKFLTKTGIPPVAKGLLMCYNMGNLKNPATTNSIIETAELKKYIGNLSNYPIPLDIAFPLFNWKVLFRNNGYIGLVQGLSDTLLTSSFVKQQGNRFELLKDTLLLGYDLRKGDLLRSEQSDISEILASANAISRRLQNNPLRVSLYHLDSVILNKYSLHELESIYSSLH